MRFLPRSSSKMLWSSFWRRSGSSIVFRMESMTHPRISFRVSQVPSPLSSFLSETASCRIVSVASGCASTSSTACRRMRRTICRRRGVPCTRPIKSSTNTSMYSRGASSGCEESTSASRGWGTDGGRRASRRLESSVVVGLGFLPGIRASSGGFTSDVSSGFGCSVGVERTIPDGSGARVGTLDGSVEVATSAAARSKSSVTFSKR